MAKIVEMKVDNSEELMEAIKNIVKVIGKEPEIDEDTTKKILDASIDYNEETGYVLLPSKKCACHLKIVELETLDLVSTISRESENIAEVLEIYGLKYDHAKFLEEVAKSQSLQYPARINSMEYAFLLANAYSTFEMTENGLVVTTLLKDGSSHVNVSVPGTFSDMKLGIKGKTFDMLECFTKHYLDKDMPDYLKNVLKAQSLDEIVVQ